MFRWAAVISLALFFSDTPAWYGGGRSWTADFYCTPGLVVREEGGEIFVNTEIFRRSEDLGTVETSYGDILLIERCVPRWKVGAGKGENER